MRLTGPAACVSVDIVADVERSLTLAQRILRLREELLAAESEYSRLIGATSRGAPEHDLVAARAVAEDRSEDPGSAAKLSDTIVGLLDSEPARIWSSLDIHTSLPHAALATIRSTLVRLHANKRVGKVGRGRWRARRVRGGGKLEME